MAADVWGGGAWLGLQMLKLEGREGVDGRASWSEAKQRSPQGEGCRWMLMPGGGGRVSRVQCKVWSVECKM